MVRPEQAPLEGHPQIRCAFELGLGSPTLAF